MTGFEFIATLKLIYKDTKSSTSNLVDIFKIKLTNKVVQEIIDEVDVCTEDELFVGEAGRVGVNLWPLPFLVMDKIPRHDVSQAEVLVTGLLAKEVFAFFIVKLCASDGFLMEVETIARVFLAFILANCKKSASSFFVHPEESVGDESSR